MPHGHIASLCKPVLQSGLSAIWMLAALRLRLQFRYCAPLRSVRQTIPQKRVTTSKRQRMAQTNCLLSLSLASPKRLLCRGCTTLSPKGTRVLCHVIVSHAECREKESSTSSKQPDLKPNQFQRRMEKLQCPNWGALQSHAVSCTPNIERDRPGGSPSAASSPRPGPAC